MWTEFIRNRRKSFNAVLHRRDFRAIRLRRAWLHLLEENSISALVGIGLSSASIDAARDLGIKTIEVQHGNLDQNSSKRYWQYSQPDILLSWDTWSSNQAEKFISDSRVIGHPINSEQSSTIAHSALQESEDDNICVALQYKRLGYIVIPFISPEIFRLLRSENFFLKQKLLFRLHPIIDARPIRRFFLSMSLRILFPKSPIHRPRDTSIEHTIAMSKALVTDTSSTAYEFGLMGKPSLVTNLISRENFVDLFNRSGLNPEMLCSETKKLKELLTLQFPTRKTFNKDAYLELLESL